MITDSSRADWHIVPEQPPLTQSPSVEQEPAPEGGEMGWSMGVFGGVSFSEEVQPESKRVITLPSRRMVKKLC